MMRKLPANGEGHKALFVDPDKPYSGPGRESLRVYGIQRFAEDFDAAQSQEGGVGSIPTKKNRLDGSGFELTTLPFWKRSKRSRLCCSASRDNFPASAC